MATGSSTECGNRLLIGLSSLFFTGHAGLRLNVNLWYPVQLTVGADYNCNIPLDKKKEVSYKNHELNRLNFYAGLRFNL